MKASHLSSTSGEPLEPEVLFLPFSWCALLPPARRCFQQGESDRPTVARAVCPRSGWQRGFSAVTSNGTPSRVYCEQQVCGSCRQTQPRAHGRSNRRCWYRSVGPGGRWDPAASALDSPKKAISALANTTPALLQGRTGCRQAHGIRERAGSSSGWDGVRFGRFCGLLYHTSVLPPLGSGGCPRVRLPRDQSWPLRRAVI